MRLAGLYRFFPAVLLLLAATAAARKPAPIHGVPGELVLPVTVEVGEIAGETMRPARSEAASERDEPGPIPQDLPLPADAFIRRETPAFRPEAARAFLGATPPLAASFLALADTGLTTPPDTHGAAGPNHLMTMLNSEARIQSRTGGELVRMTLFNFWTKASGFSDLTDPRVAYDSAADRWVVTALAAPGQKDSAVLVGVSQSGDPTGAWSLYRVDADSTDAAWADYPSMGIDAARVVIQVNMFKVPASASDSQPFVRSQVFVFDKQTLYAGGPARPTVIPLDSVGGTQVPATSFDPFTGTTYLVQNWNGNAAGSGYLRLYALTGASGSESLFPVALIASPLPWDSVPASGTNPAPQKGSDEKINNGDARMQSVVLRNGFLWCAHTVFLPAGGSARSAVQWWQLGIDGSVAQRGRIDDSSGATFFAYPSLAVNRDNHVLVGYTRFAAAQFPTAVYAYRSATDPPNILRDEMVLKEGEAFYVKFFNGSRNRWGDYSSAAVDPANGADFWTIQEYAAAHGTDLSSRWGTWWGRVVAEPASTPAAAFRFLPDAPVEGLPVAFTDLSSNGPVSWAWSFGNGAVSAEQNPTAVFPAGTYSVSLTVRNSAGSATSTRSIVVLPSPGRPPIVPASRPRSKGGR